MTTIVSKANYLAEIQVSYKTKVKPSERKKITQAKDCYDILKEVWDMDNIEHVESAVLLLLNRTNQVLGWFKLSVGGVAGTVIDKKVIFQIALNANASHFIVSHNHPSGTLKASESDIRLTRDLKTAAKMLDLELLDHVIITSEGYISLADEGLM